jgi:hypothetical protein
LLELLKIWMEASSKMGPNPWSFTVDVDRGVVHGHLQKEREVAHR